jgi:hypothetical protein
MLLDYWITLYVVRQDAHHLAFRWFRNVTGLRDCCRIDKRIRIYMYICICNIEFEYEICIICRICLMFCHSRQKFVCLCVCVIFPLWSLSLPPPPPTSLATDCEGSRPRKQTRQAKTCQSDGWSWGQKARHSYRHHSSARATEWLTSHDLHNIYQHNCSHHVTLEWPHGMFSSVIQAETSTLAAICSHTRQRMHCCEPLALQPSCFHLYHHR